MARVVYAQKLLSSDLKRIQCSSFKDRTEKYLCCEDGWTLRVPNDETFKFRQVWIQGFVLEYIPSKDFMLLDDGSDSPFTVVNVAKNPTSNKWLLKDQVFDETVKFYVQVLGEPVVVKGTKNKTFHVAAIKVQNLTEDATPRASDLASWRLKAAFDATPDSEAMTPDERLRLFAWMLEVQDAQRHGGGVAS